MALSTESFPLPELSIQEILSDLERLIRVRELKNAPNLAHLERNFQNLIETEIVDTL
jgi:hypothetical protein